MPSRFRKQEWPSIVCAATTGNAAAKNAQQRRSIVVIATVLCVCDKSEENGVGLVAGGKM
jgi:hypothetical protein